jgi:transcriptional repressor NrdR
VTTIKLKESLRVTSGPIEPAVLRNAVARSGYYTIVWLPRSLRHHILWGAGSTVRCPFCGSDGSRVVDSRDSEAGDAIRRRRECIDCDRRYTTYERVEEVPLIVTKRDGREEVFARQKLLNGLLRATEKRDIALERLERAVDEIENDLRRIPGRTVTTGAVGEEALRHLREIDKVAYVRFASVYKQFDTVDEFQEELARLDSFAEETDQADTGGGLQQAAEGGREQGEVKAWLRQEAQ